VAFEYDVIPLPASFVLADAKTPSAYAPEAVFLINELVLAMVDLRALS
jgi:hypothetical protein